MFAFLAVYRGIQFRRIGYSTFYLMPPFPSRMENYRNTNPITPSDLLPFLVAPLTPPHQFIVCLHCALAVFRTRRNDRRGVAIHHDLPPT
jgi:hypothetical protein